MATATHLDSEQLVADLAWNFCEETKRGEAVPMKAYLDQCPDNEARELFKDLVNTDLLLHAVVSVERHEQAC